MLRWFKKAIADHGDCYYGDGACVGAYARLYLEREGDRLLRAEMEKRNPFRFSKGSFPPLTEADRSPLLRCCLRPRGGPHLARAARPEVAPYRHALHQHVSLPGQ